MRLTITQRSATHFEPPAGCSFSKLNHPLLFRFAYQTRYRGTAAHCVAIMPSHYWSDDIRPAYNNGRRRLDHGLRIRNDRHRLLQRTDNCYQYGVICPDDVALTTLKPKWPLPGASTGGWLWYGGYDFNKAGQALITQLAIHWISIWCSCSERSQSFVYAAYSNNTIIGSLIPGSSGGPWTVTLDTAACRAATRSAPRWLQRVVGVTSWVLPASRPSKWRLPLTSGISSLCYLRSATPRQARVSKPLCTSPQQ